MNQQIETTDKHQVIYDIQSPQIRSNSVQDEEVGVTVKENGNHEPSLSSSEDTPSKEPLQPTSIRFCKIEKKETKHIMNTAGDKWVCCTCPFSTGEGLRK